MKTIDINLQKGIKITKFPDQQSHVNIADVQENEEVKVICSLTSADALLQLLECSNALDHLFAKKKILEIPYLMGARYDRVMQKGDSADLQVIAQLINTCNFQKVILHDVHSDVATMLIRNAVNTDNRQLVEKYQHENAVLICPDAGSAKKIHHYFDWNKNLTDVVYCIKNRDLATGKIALKVLEPEKCKNRNCVIIDDICDGGATFLAISEQIEPQHLSLMVTHGIFSKGFEKLEKTFDEIITSDSLRKEYHHPKVKTIPLEI